jgi:hypothetical protein
MNITKIKQIYSDQKAWNFKLDGRRFIYITNRRGNYTDVYTVDATLPFISYSIPKYIPLDPDPINREQSIRKYFALIMLQ